MPRSHRRPHRHRGEPGGCRKSAAAATLLAAVALLGGPVLVALLW